MFGTKEGEEKSLGGLRDGNGRMEEEMETSWKRCGQMFCGKRGKTFLKWGGRREEDTPSEREKQGRFMGDSRGGGSEE